MRNPCCAMATWQGALGKQPKGPDSGPVRSVVEIASGLCVCVAARKFKFVFMF